MTERELKMEQRIAELEALAVRKDQQLAAQDQWLTEQKHRIAAQDRQLTQMQHQLDRLGELITNAQRARFGQSSEKQKYVLGNQLSLFNEAEAEQNPKAPEPTEKTFVSAHERKPKRPYSELTQGIPTRDIEIELEGDDLICGKCGGELRKIGKKLAYTELEIIPQKVTLLRYFTCTYACDKCIDETGGNTSIYHSVAPARLLKHSLASASTVADVMTKKYVYALPLYRQEKIWKQLGVELSRATMANWVIQTAQRWLKPVYRRMKAHLLEQNLIHADETVVQVLKEPGKSATSESRMWVYASGEGSSKPVRCFEYQPDRSAKRPVNFLKGFKGCLVTDGYAAYEQVPEVTLCGCWAHMRRKWREAMPKGATTKNSKAAVGYQYCNRLFRLEKKFADLTPELKKTARQAAAEPLLDAYWLWLDTVHPEPGSKLEEAVTYAKNQRKKLSQFLTHPVVPVSNNLAERSIKPFVVGRKNWLFSDTVKGAEASAVVYSLVETATANGVEPYDYLLCLLKELTWLGKHPANDALDQLLPWHPYMKKQMEQQAK